VNADEQIQEDRELLRAAPKDSDDWDDATWAAWWRTAERHDPHFKRKVTTAAAVAAQGALPMPVATVMPVAPQGRPRTMLDRARDALNARMTKDDLRLVLENVITHADALKDRIAELEAEREKLVRWHGEDSKTINRLVTRTERRHAELVALRNDALNMRGSLSPNGEKRKVPFPLGETLTPAVDWLIGRVAELEAERHTTNEALSDAAEALRANRDRIAELERPAVEAKRNEIRSSYAETIAMAREDRDFEGAFNLGCQLREREEQWKREDEEAAS
jgi:chromosome segregation ATPase